MLYSMGRNIAGYMPESDVTWYADREEAARALADKMREYADRDDESAWELLPGDAETARAHGYAVAEDGSIDYGDDTPAMRATVDSILTDDGPEACNDGWLAYAEDSSGRMIAFWLHAEDFDPEYAATRDGVRVEVEKVGGGTVGEAYEGYWRYAAHAEDGELLGCGNDFHTGTPVTHHIAARWILEFLESDH